MLPVPSRRTDEDYRRIVNREQWTEIEGTWSKKVPFAREFSIELTIKTLLRDEGSKIFKIEVVPTAVLADAWSCLMMGAEFAQLPEAQGVYAKSRGDLRTFVGTPPFMQALDFLWFELQAARRRLRETFAEDHVPPDAANGSADAPSSVGTLK
jgi:hypothetical protein